MTLKIHSLPVGPLQANCHIAENTETRDAIIFDPGDEADAILRHLAKHQLNPVAIWLTHAHIDHIGALAAVHDATKAPVSIHHSEETWLADPVLNLAAWIGAPFTPCKADHLWRGDEQLDAIGHRWSIMHVPGHSPGVCAIICNSENLAITGDLIFRGSMGRTDLPGGDPVAMADSLSRFLELPASLRLFPGHGDDTTLAVEQKENWVVREFLGRM